MSWSSPTPSRCPKGLASGKIRQLSCAALLGETILRISNAESVSSLFVD